MDNEAGSNSSQEDRHPLDGTSGETKQKSKLVAGDEQILEWVREVWSFDDPIICIWQVEEDPATLDLLNDDKFMAIDFVRFYNKEHFHSLFFPLGFRTGVYNLVLAGIREDNKDIIHVPMNGMLRGWLLGTDMEELLIDVDLDV